MQRLYAGILRVLGERPGTGFALAPDLVATCAHVVGRQREPGTIVGGAPWQQDALDLRLLAIDGAVDLALLSCEGPSPCPLQPLPLNGDCRRDDPVGAVGFPASADGRPERDELTAVVEGETHRTGGRRLLKLKGGQFSPGYSGAPLLHLRTGYICGIVRETRDRRSDLGGRAIPIADLLALCAKHGLQVPELPPLAGAAVSPGSTPAERVGEVVTPATVSQPEIIDRLAELLRRSMSWQDPHTRRQFADRALWDHPLRDHLRLDANPADDAMELAMACVKHDDPADRQRAVCLVLDRLAGLPQGTADRDGIARLRALLRCTK